MSTALRHSRPTVTHRGPRARCEEGRRWESEVERAWRNTPEDGPNWLKMRFLLNPEFLAHLFPSTPWRFRGWTED
jgi:hypothetical protein